MGASSKSPGFGRLISIKATTSAPITLSFFGGEIAHGPAIGRKIIELLDGHRIMTLATNRPDGWPQATTVGYVNDGLTLYSCDDP